MRRTSTGALHIGQTFAGVKYVISLGLTESGRGGDADRKLMGELRSLSSESKSGVCARCENDESGRSASWLPTWWVIMGGF